MSSRHNGPQAFAGAKGKARPMDVIERPEEANTPMPEKVEMTDAEIVEMLQQDGVSRMRKLMRPHTELAVETLAEVAGNSEASASARVTASKAILDYGYGKPVSIVPSQVGGGSTGLRINLIQFFPNAGATSEHVTLEAEVEDMIGS